MNVRSVERLGGESYFYGTSISGDVLTVHRLGQTDVTFDTELTLEFDIEQEHLFDAETSYPAPGRGHSGMKQTWRWFGLKTR